MSRFKMSENAKCAYKYLMKKYPEPPNIKGSVIKKDIMRNFVLTKEEVYAAYYNWKEDGAGMSGAPKLKDVIHEECKTVRIEWSKNLDKLKEIYGRYVEGEDIESLADEIMSSKKNLSSAFTTYKRSGILPNMRKMKNKNHIIMNGKKFTGEEVREILKRINNGEKTRHIAKELGINEKRLSNACNYYRDRFINK